MVPIIAFWSAIATIIMFEIVSIVTGKMKSELAVLPFMLLLASAVAKFIGL